MSSSESGGRLAGDGFHLENLPVAAAFSICGKQAESVSSEYKGVSATGAFKDLLIYTFCAMRVQKSHIIKAGFPFVTCGARHANIFAGHLVYYRCICGTHISISTLANLSCSTTIHI